MPYADLLNHLIENAGLNNKQLCDACAQQGVKLTPAYISLLRNPQEERTASEAVSRALARALGEENEELLVIQGYLDKAPSCLLELKNFYRDYMASAVAAELAGGRDDIRRDVLAQDYKKLPFSELFAEFTDTVIGHFVMQMQNNNANPIKNGKELLSRIDSENDLTIRDDSMVPLFLKGTHIILEQNEDQNEYRSGDIVCFFCKDESRIQVRRLAILGANRFAMIPENPSYEVMEFSGSEIVLMGKVKQAVIDL